MRWQEASKKSLYTVYITEQTQHRRIVMLCLALTNITNHPKQAKDLSQNDMSLFLGRSDIINFSLNSSKRALAAFSIRIVPVVSP